MIAIVDYGMGNVRSVANAFDYLGAECTVTADPRQLEAADRLVLPGVGAFGDAMKNLAERGLIGSLDEQVRERKKPFLGICLGMQLLAQSSNEHGTHAGLGWLDAEVRPLDARSHGLNLPHIGWNDIDPCLEHPMFAGLRDGEFTFYFVHSFRMVCEGPTVAARCEYGEPFVAAVASENIFATQFHPEKSQDNGLQVLENFLSWHPGT